MKISRFKRVLPILIMALFLLPSNAKAQRFGMQSDIVGWVDDQHYLKRSEGEGGETVILKVNVKTGDSQPYPEYSSRRQEFADALPEGFSLGWGVSIDDDQEVIVIEKDNDLWSFRLGQEEALRLTTGDEPELNPALSPSGKLVAFTRAKDLYYIDLETGEETRLTFDAQGKIYNGYASWVYMEEILGRGSRYSAFWWSPDSRKIAYLHTDENPVPEFIINRIDEEDGLHGTQEVTPYPKPGDNNPAVKMGVVDISNASTTWIKTDESVDQYIAWPAWTVDSKSLMVQVLNRDQDDMQIILADVASGDYREIYRETNDTWIDFFSDVFVLESGKGFILRSSRSGWNNLYLYDFNGELVSKITDVDWRVNGISRVDEKNGIVWFTGTGPESTDSHLFKTGLNGKGLVQVTSGPGTHSGSISPGGKYVIDTWSNITTAPTVTLLDARGKIIRDIDRPAGQGQETRMAKSELVRIPSTDGFMLPAVITYPVDFDENEKYPVVFTIYGGPDAGGVRNRYMGRASWFAENNIITISVDHRASGHFGKKGLDYMHRNLGKWEIHDYSKAVEYLRAKPYVDPDRMGISGGSYGGYTTALALTKGADYWTHGIANYSVTDWRLYDNVYTERFMDTPADNPEGYRDGSVLTYAENLKGKLYIVHGMADDNVHMQNSIYLVSKLQDLDKEFDFMIYAGGRHGWGGPKAVHHRNAQNRHWLEWFFGE